jgi:hypothetical protein
MVRVSRWPVREAILAYLKLMKDSALENHKTSMLMWSSLSAFGGKVKAPVLPEILR